MKTNKARAYKLLSFMVSVVLLLGLVPMAAFGAAPGDEAEWTTNDGVTGSGTLARALGAVSSVGGNIRLLLDVSTSASSLPLQPTTLDLNDCSLTPERSLVMSDGCVFTVDDLSINKGGKIVGNNSDVVDGTGGTLMIKGGTLTAEGQNYAINNFSKSTVIIDGGIVQKTASGGAAVSNLGDLTISGGVVQKINPGDAILNHGPLTISGGTVQANDWALNNSDKVTVSGGTIRSISSPTFNNDSTGTMAITGGTFLSGRSLANLNAGAITISGGSVGSIRGSGTITNVAGDSVTLCTLTLENIAAETPVTALTFDPALSYTYGTNDMKTDSNGKLYVWLPSAQAAAAVTVTTDDATYSGAIANDAATLTAVPTVTSVSVGPQEASVQVGTTQQFAATVTGTPSTPQTVTWTVGGAQSTATIIDANGRLTVAGDETAPSFTVQATSTLDATKSGTATVTVTPAPITPVTPVTPITPVTPTTPTTPTSSTVPISSTPATPLNTGTLLAKTGDKLRGIEWLAAAFVSAGGVVALSRKRRKSMV